MVRKKKTEKKTKRDNRFGLQFYFVLLSLILLSRFDFVSSFFVLFGRRPTTITTTTTATKKKQTNPKIPEHLVPQASMAYRALR